MKYNKTNSEPDYCDTPCTKIIEGMTVLNRGRRCHVHKVLGSGESKKLYVTTSTGGTLILNEKHYMVETPR